VIILNGRPTGARKLNGCGASGFAAALALGLALGAGSQSAVADPLRYRRAVLGSEEAVIGIGTRFNKACLNIGVPQVVLDVAPEHGFVCIRSGTVKPRNLLFGTAAQCLDTPMKGVQIVYRSRTGFTGNDRLGYTMKFPRGERHYAVDLRVSVAGGNGNSQDNAAILERQPPGPMPECAALVS
jgi:hypothetical protein